MLILPIDLPLAGEARVPYRPKTWQFINEEVLTQ